MYFEVLCVYGPGCRVTSFDTRSLPIQWLYRIEAPLKYSPPQRRPRKNTGPGLLFTPIRYVTQTVSRSRSRFLTQKTSIRSPWYDCIDVLYLCNRIHAIITSMNTAYLRIQTQSCIKTVNYEYRISSGVAMYQARHVAMHRLLDATLHAL